MYLKTAAFGLFLLAVPHLALAQENGLNDSINKAVAEVVKTGAGTETVKEEIPSKPSKSENVWYHSSQVALGIALVMDMKTTASAINNPLRVSYTDCTFSCNTVRTIATFSEGGWATSVLGIDGRNTKGIVAANVAGGASVLIASHFLSKKGGNWRKLAIGLNFVQASLNMSGAIGNIRKVNAARATLVPAGAINIRW